jgi:outer membrane protein
VRYRIITAIALASVATPVCAEGLGEAIADAYRNNPRLQAQRAQLRALDENVVQAGAPYRLNMSLDANMSYTFQRDRNPLVDQFITSKNKNIGTALTASQILSNGGRTAAQVSAAEADVLSGREALRETENAILLEVVDSYISVRRDQEIVGIQRRSVQSYERQVQQARARERAGDLTRTDIAQATAQLEIVRSQLVQSEASLETSRARFAAVVGRNPGQLDPEPALPGLPISVEAAYRAAETDSPALMQAVLNERSGRARVSAARAERRPTVTLNGSYGYVSRFSWATRDLGQGYSGDLNVRIPILSGGVIASRVRQAIADRQSLTFLIEDARRNVSVALLNSWNQSIAGRDQIVAGEAAVTSATAALEGVRRGFAEGFRSNFEVLDSEQRLLNAQLVLASARYNRYAGQASLLATLGRLEAAALEQATIAYDVERNLRRQRNLQFGPFEVVLKPLDKLLKPGGGSGPAPVLPVPSDTTVASAQTPPPQGALARVLPLRADEPGQTAPLPTRDKLSVLPPQSRTTGVPGTPQDDQ